jgi:hypothetical protein
MCTLRPNRVWWTDRNRLETNGPDVHLCQMRSGCIQPKQKDIIYSMLLDGDYCCLLTSFKSPLEHRDEVAHSALTKLMNFSVNSSQISRHDRRSSVGRSKQTAGALPLKYKMFMFDVHFLSTILGTSIYRAPPRAHM